MRILKLEGSDYNLAMIDRAW